MKKKIPALATIVIIVVVVFVLIQFIPYGRTVANPAIINEPKWDSATTKALVRASCYDCHSYETTRPWYSYVAPASWLLQRDVDEGRRALNFSDWPTETSAQLVKIDEIKQEITEGGMPPPQYTLIHPSAKLSSAQVDQIIASLEASVSK